MVIHKYIIYIVDNYRYTHGYIEVTPATEDASPSDNPEAIHSY